MKHLHDPTLAPASPIAPDDWERITPHLDDALNELSESDRHIVLLRYFKGWSFEEMANQLGGQSAAWRQRGSRAIDRLRRRLARHGTVVPVAILAAALGATFSQAAPSAVVVSLTTVPLAAAASLSWKTLALHTLHTMNAKQISLAVAVIVTVLIPLGFQAVAVHRSQSRVAALETIAMTLRAAAGIGPGGSGMSLRTASAIAGSSSANSGSSPTGGIDLHEMAQLMAEGRDADPLRVLKFRAMLNSLDAETLDGLLAAAETLDFPPDHRRVLYARLLSVLAEKDPVLATTTGMRLVATLTGNEATLLWMNPLPNCLREWAQKDPHAALTWYKEQQKADGFQNKSLGDPDLAGWMASGLFTGIMWGGDRTTGLAFFETLDDAAREVALRRFGTSNTNPEDHAQILKLAAGLSKAEARADALMGATLTLGKSDLTKAGTFISEAGLPSAETRKLLVAAAVAPLNETRDADVVGRLAWLRTQTPADQQEKALGYFLGDAAFTDHAGIKQKVDAEIAAGASDVFLGAFIRNAAHRTSTMHMAVNYLSHLTDPAERTRTLRDMQQGHRDVARAAVMQAGISVAELDAALQAK